MSVNYAAGLSPYENKGVCGLPEFYDSDKELSDKIDTLVDYIRQSSHRVVHTGAGISTACGIPDFRGPSGVWTLENAGKTPTFNVTFDSAVPSFTHRALCVMEQQGFLQLSHRYLITQNVDGLHLRSGFPRDRLSILHGDMFTERCDRCDSEHHRTTAVGSIGQKHTGNVCGRPRPNGRGDCRGRLRDSVLDWEHCLPQPDMYNAELHSRAADLSICLGTSLRICPAGEFPTWTRKRGGKLVIVNLQKTKQHAKADLVLHARVDDVMRRVCDRLNLTIPASTGPRLVLTSAVPAVDIKSRLSSSPLANGKTPAQKPQRKRKSKAAVKSECDDSSTGNTVDIPRDTKCVKLEPEALKADLSVHDVSTCRVTAPDVHTVVQSLVDLVVRESAL